MFCDPFTKGEAGVVTGFGGGLRRIAGLGSMPTILISLGSTALSCRVKIPVPAPTSTTRSEAGASAITAVRCDIS